MSDNLTAAQSGDRRKALEEVRDTLASALDAAALKGDGTVAQLAAQYRAVLAEIAALPAKKAPDATATGVVGLDEARQRLKDRRATATPDADAGQRSRKPRRSGDSVG